MISNIPTFVQRTFSDAIWRISSSKAVYLTFDDGPIPEVTSFVLDTLAKYDVKATFFCVGENVVKYPFLYKRILAEGHAVGNHSYNHLNGWKTKTRLYIENVDLAQSDISNPNCSDPPYGKLSPSQYKQLKEKYDIVMWDVLSLDYDKNMTPNRCFELVKNTTNTGSIIVFHDNVKSHKILEETLPRVIEYFLSQEWKLEVLTSKLNSI